MLSTLEREIIEKFHLLDATARQRVRALIEREMDSATSIGDPNLTEDQRSWAEFIEATYGSMADDPMDESDNSKLPLSDKLVSTNWLENKRAIRAEMRAKYGTFQFSVAELVNETREERMNDLMDRY